MRLAFMGTPEFAVPTLDALVAAGHEVVVVYTQPPRPANRGKKLTPSSVQARAEELGLPVRTPVSLRNAEAQAEFAAFDLDVAAVTARLIDRRVVLSRDLPRLPGRIHVRPQGLCFFDAHLRRICLTPDPARLASRIKKYAARLMCDEVLMPMDIDAAPHVNGLVGLLIDVSPAAAKLAAQCDLSCIHHFDGLQGISCFRLSN